jgi:phosphoribosyl 1,2-cyclic phosphodiesterase
VDVATQPQPPVRGDNTVEYRFLDASGHPVEGVVFTVRPWMPSHGHGSSITPTVEERGNGAYRVTHVYLFMDSTWELQATVTAPWQDAFTVTCEVRG